MKEDVGETSPDRDGGHGTVWSVGDGDVCAIALRRRGGEHFCGDVHAERLGHRVDAVGLVKLAGLEGGGGDTFLQNSAFDMSGINTTST